MKKNNINFIYNDKKISNNNYYNFIYKLSI